LKGFLDIRAPTSLRLAIGAAGESLDPASMTAPSPFVFFKQQAEESHPSFNNLVLLVFGAVLQVVCVSLPGYIIARAGGFNADQQRFLANLNVNLFTPCLIFTKLASQLNADKLLDLGIIPIIFVIQTSVSYVVSHVVARCFGFNRRASNFVTAMGVFGNSNSLPISLVMSLSQTLKGLHWDRIPGDNDDEVAARGILYLLVFQQLGQLVRWSWGYHVLLAPKARYEEYTTETIEEGRYHDEEVDDERERHVLIEGVDILQLDADEHEHEHEHDHEHHRPPSPTHTDDSRVYEPAGRTPVGGSSGTSPNDSEDEDHGGTYKANTKSYTNALGLNAHLDDYEGLDRILSFPRIRSTDEPEAPPGIKGVPVRVRRFVRKAEIKTWSWLRTTGQRAYNSLPKPAQLALTKLLHVWQRIYNFLWAFMNPPLWAMLLAILVASVPSLQALFFREGSFLKTSVTAAISSSAGVAVPLILVVLGANLARNTQARDDEVDAEEKHIGTRLLVASLVSRMLLPTLVMAPILALFAKYVPVSILDDPIFVIVCFLLTGAPSALQLAQICQINNVYEMVMGRILFQSYVIW
jgi:predicted permease